jgi:hypothetical protein
MILLDLGGPGARKCRPGDIARAHQDDAEQAPKKQLQEYYRNRREAARVENPYDEMRDRLVSMFTGAAARYHRPSSRRKEW